jgi:putative flavoprotein involved in K+ transport
MTQTSPSGRASAWLDHFGAALGHHDAAATAALFDADCYWRDLVAFTGTICTQEGQSAV